MYYAEVTYPVFRKSKGHLGPEDVEKSRKLLNVRIHVEGVI